MAKTVSKLPTLKGAGKDLVITFDSLSEFVDYAQAAPAPQHIREKTSGRSWDGGQSYDDAAKLARAGDISRVAASDAFMNRLEDIIGFERQTFRTVDAVSGGVPNIPALIANQPLAMRRRQRVISEQAPLNVVVDLVSSGGIDASKLEKRGAAVLALVRLLSAVRPVNLYAVTAAKPWDQNRYASAGFAVRLDTAPLDIARAAHVFGSPAFARNLIYRLTSYEAHGNWDIDGLSWPFDDVNFYRANGAHYWERALGAGECLFMAPPYLNDMAIDDPERFIKEKIAEYGQAAE